MNHRYKGIIFYIFFCIANICLLGSIFLEKTFIKKAPETITAHFYHEVLNKKETLFDPYDLKYVVQYSLLQNLAVGLIRESIENPNGFDPLLVDYWFQESDTMWKFKLKENLKWSNGAPIKASEIIESFNRLIASSARQLVYLRDVKTIHYEPASNMLSFEFNKKTPRDVLQEFSHPHAVILHPSNHNLNWEITSGPYFVKQYDVVNEKLLLSLNTHCNIRRYNQSRDVLLLGGIKDKSEMINFFDSVDMDVFFISPPVFHPVYQKMKRDKQNIRLHKGVPTVTRTFQYNLDHPFAKNKKAREEIAWIIDSFYKHAEMLDSEMAYTNQLIPFGYTGRLKDYERKQVPINEILGKTITIVATSNFFAIEPQIKALSAFSQKHFNVAFNLTLEKFDRHGMISQEAALQILGFQSSATDTLSSWRYFVSKKYKGALSLEFETYNPMLENATILHGSEKVNAIKKFHKHVLDSGYIIPVTVEPVQYITSKRINLKHWNPFIMNAFYYRMIVNG